MDELEKRQKRRQEQKRRQAQQKKILLRLGLAAVVLVLCGIVIAVNAGSSSDPSTDPPETPENTAPAVSDTSQTTTPPDPTTVIHFVAGGDLNITQRVTDSADADGSFTSVLQDVGYLLADADLSVVNLEGNFCGSPYGENASAPQALAESLSRAGVDMLQLANSYSIHRGVSGLLSTVDAVKAAGLTPVGVFRDSQDYKSKKGFSMFEVEGVRVAVVAFTKGMDGMTLPPGSEDCVNILYTDYDSVYQNINKVKIHDVLQNVQAEQPDVTIALLHWGSEYNDTISNSQESICKLLRQEGVDAVIGTHSHYVHKIEYDEGFLAAYCLGDFLGDANRAGSEYSVLLDIEITKNNTTGQADITGYCYTPIFTVAEEDQPLRVVRIHEAMAAYEAGHRNAVSQSTYDAMAYALTRIEARIAGE